MKPTRLRQPATLAALLLSASPALRAADGSISFDGVDDFVEVPNFHTLGVTNEVTVEFWAKADMLKQQAAFMLNPDNASNRFQASISYFNGNTYWDFGDIGIGGRVFVANPANAVGNWTHYAFVASESATTERMKIYVNGAQVASVNTMDAFETLVGSSLRIGGSTGFFFDGSLDEFRVWNVARPQSAIQATMGGPLTGSEAGLRLYFKFDEATGPTAANSATATSATHPYGTAQGNPVWSATPARKIYVVANANDSGPDSLRAILTTAATEPGPALITFDSTLNGGTITLIGPQDGSALDINDPGGVTIDATSLSGGVTIQRNSGNSLGFRLFRVASGSSLALTGLTLKDGGGAGGASFDGGGGGIFNEGTLTLTRCTLIGNSAFSGGGISNNNTGTLTVTWSTLSGNSADNSPIGGSGGGGIRNSGTLTVTRSTLSDNSADNSIGGGGGGGGIYNTGTLTVTQSTLSGNSSDGSYLGGGGIYNAGTLTVAQSTLSGNSADNSIGGAILNNATLTLTHCTLSGNSARSGGGIIIGGTLTLTNSIVAGNTATDSGADIYQVDNDDTVNANGANIVQTAIVGGTVNGSSTIANVNPLLTPLADNGGPTDTMALLPGSPARNAAAVLSPAITSDQRGFPIAGVPDIGAYEASPITPAGIHQNLGGRWRTASVGKPQDIDGNNVLGTDGYHVVNHPAVLPAYVGTTTILTTTYPGNNQYALLDDPLAMPGTFRSGTMNPAPGVGNAADLFQFTLNAQAAGRIIRVGLLVDHLNAPGFNSVSLQLVQTAPESAGSPVVSTTSTAFNDLLADWVFMDIEVGAGGGTFLVRGVAGVQGTATLGGVSFDSVSALLVTNTNDSGPGSLRQALATAAAVPGADTITFAPGLTGPITLTSGEIVITSDVTIDATSLPAGLTLSGGSTSRIFSVSTGRTVLLRALTLTGGSGIGADTTGSGGAVFNRGNLLLTQCTLSGNTVNNSGGAIHNVGGILTLTQCTLSGNNASTGGGGALGSTDFATLIHCTVSGNSAGFGGGGLNCDNALTLSNTIIGNNTAPVDAGPDLRGDGGTKTLQGVNIIPSVAFVNGATFGGSGTRLTDAPLLAPLGSYGGPTQTMALRPNSPASNAATGSTITSDQRGFPIVGQRDIGAYEAGTFTNYNAYIYESLPATATLAQHATNFDYDGDGVNNTNEWAALTDPASPASVFRITSAVKSGGNVVITFPTVSGKSYTLWQSDILTGTWTNTGQTAIPGDGSPKAFTAPAPVNGVPKRFHRVQVGP